MAGGLVTVIVMQAFVESGPLEQAPAYADTPPGARAFLQDRVPRQLEAKFTTEGDPAFTSRRADDVERLEPGTWAVDVRCESAETVADLDVRITHGETSVECESQVAKTPPK